MTQHSTRTNLYYVRYIFFFLRTSSTVTNDWHNLDRVFRKPSQLKIYPRLYYKAPDKSFSCCLKCPGFFKIIHVVKGEGKASRLRPNVPRLSSRWTLTLISIFLTEANIGNHATWAAFLCLIFSLELCLL
jgi:hypothetical protein